MSGDAAQSIVWRWDALEDREWDRLVAAAPEAALEQSWAYGAAVAAVSPYRPRRGVALLDGRPAALAQICQRPALGALVVAQLLRGPVLLAALDPVTMAAIYRPLAEAYRIRRRRLLFWTPPLAKPEADAAMAALGKRPMVAGHATIRLDLGASEAALRGAMDQKWRNRLQRAEGAKLRVDAAHGGKTLELLAARHDAAQRARRLHGPSGAEISALVDRLSRRDDAVILTAYVRNDPVAGALFVRHGRAVTYHVAWTSPEGRLVHAHNLLVWRGVLLMKERGAAALDLGGLNALSPGVARFKLGLSGKIVELPGPYL